MVILLAENEVASSVDGSYLMIVNTLRCKINVSGCVYRVHWYICDTVRPQYDKP